MLPKLEQSGLFKKVEFSSPTIRDTRQNADRFVIKMQMEVSRRRRREGRRMKGRSRLVSVAAPVIVILAGLVAYQYGYLAVKGEVASLRERQTARWATLHRYLKLIAERPLFEKRL
jgi:hypothetical protein